LTRQLAELIHYNLCNNAVPSGYHSSIGMAWDTTASVERYGVDVDGPERIGLQGCLPRPRAAGSMVRAVDVSRLRFNRGQTCFCGRGTRSFLLTAHALAMGLALAVGVTQAHFLIDSGPWRLKEKPQRSIIQESFDFLFQPQPGFSAVTRMDASLGAGGAD
jgi:hypothetical protein